MNTTAIGVITRGPSDMLEVLLTTSGVRVKVLRPEHFAASALSDLQALAIIGGTEDAPIVLHAPQRLAIEAFLTGGGRLLSEYCESIRYVYSAPPVSTRFDRLVVCAGAGSARGPIPDLEPGDLLDDQANTRIKPYTASSRTPPILHYSSTAISHDRVEVTPETYKEAADRALWFETERLLMSSFRMCNFNRARFAPRARWHALVGYVLGWLCGCPVNLVRLPQPYELGPRSSQTPLEGQLADCIERGIRWFSRAGMLVRGGRGGVREGLGTEIDPSGNQRIAGYVRNDCTGEASLAFFLHSLLTGNKTSRTISERLASFCFDFLQEKTDGPYHGMMRWSETAWGVCYQDDVARAIIPQMLTCLFTGSKAYLEECVAALRFLVKTTGTDGLRVARTDLPQLTVEEIEKLASQPGNLPSAHYNAYYLGALALAYKLTGTEEFRATAVRGIESIMSVYPDTRREMSETEELCRLVLPLAWLFWVTGEQRHRDFLYRVTDDLQRFRHPSGAYLEWDTGYQASLSRTRGGECSLLARNGDPVVELLYSLNWLPMGFAQAYLVTGDARFKTLWEAIARFMVGAQVRSANEKIDGAWTRALDVERREVYGLPNDIGWGPWAIESGWTVAEIVSGLCAGLLAERLQPCYR